MGDRANVVVRDEWTGSRNHAAPVGNHEAVFLYGHWAGYDLPEQLRLSLAKRERWDDPTYLTRILRDDIQGITGISTRLTDNEYDLLVLLPREARIVRIPEDAYRSPAGLDPTGHPSISFEDYVNADERTWDNLTEVFSGASREEENDRGHH